MDKIDRTLFFAGYRKLFTPLTQGQVDGLEYLLGRLEMDPHIVDLRHAAYMLATTMHETAYTFQPIEEYGKGAGKRYGKFYGRGFAQLTWDYNYLKMGKILGEDLLAHPELALRPDIAYIVLSYGMRHGVFTGKKLTDYINDETCDYENARRIINGKDRAIAVAQKAMKFEKILKGARI